MARKPKQEIKFHEQVGNTTELTSMSPLRKNHFLKNVLTTTKTFLCKSSSDDH